MSEFITIEDLGGKVKHEVEIDSLDEMRAFWADALDRKIEEHGRRQKEMLEKIMLG